MNKISNGIDLIEIGRLTALDPKIKERFIKRVFTPAEYASSSGIDEHLAGKFAAKEAAAKALGCGIGEVKWQDLEILSDEVGKPVLSLHGNALDAAQKCRWIDWSVSISHTSAYAVAAVTALIESPQE